MKPFCYSIRDYLNGKKLAGGMVYANDFDEAIQFAVKQSQLTQEVSGSAQFPGVNWVRNGRKVYLFMNVNAGHHLTKESQEALRDLVLGDF